MTHYTAPRRALAVGRIERARAAGDLRQDIDPVAVVDQLWGACYARLLNPDLPVTIEFADSLLNNLWRGVAG